MEDKNIPSRREQVLIQVQLIYLLQHVTTREEKKRNAIEFLTRSALRASRFKTERTEKIYTERNQGDLTGTNSCINWCSFILDYVCICIFQSLNETEKTKID